MISFPNAMNNAREAKKIKKDLEELQRCFMVLLQSTSHLLHFLAQLELAFLHLHMSVWFEQVASLALDVHIEAEISGELGVQRLQKPLQPEERKATPIPVRSRASTQRWAERNPGAVFHSFFPCFPLSV